MEFSATNGPEFIDLAPSPFDDDAFTLTASIKNAYLKDSYTVYLINLSLLCRPNQRWEIEKRFKEFCAFDESLRKIGWSVGTLPEKKWFGNKDRELISRRQIELEKYISGILSIPQLNSSGIVRNFLFPLSFQSETNEILNTAQQQVALTLRSEPRFNFIRFLPQIGWRRRKVFALANLSASERGHLIVSWTEFCLKNACFDQEISTALKWFQTNGDDGVLLPFVFSSLTNRAALTIQPLNYPALRDVLRSVEHPFNESFVKKYSPGNFSQNIQRGFSKEAYWNMTRSIFANLVLFLAHFHSQGLFLANIHAGNLTVDLKPDRNGHFQCQITESHGALLGILPPYYSRLLQLGPNAVRSVFDIDVAALGFLLQEIVEFCPEMWQIPGDVSNLMAKMNPVPNGGLPSASEIVQFMRNEPQFSSALQQIESQRQKFFEPPSKEVARIYAKARFSYEKRLSLHHAVFYQVSAVKNVRRSLVTSSRTNNQPDDAADSDTNSQLLKDVHSSSHNDSIIFAN